MAEPPMHRYNRALPPAYRDAVAGEARLLRRALLTIAKSDSNYSDDLADPSGGHESYELSSERALSALEKGVSRSQDLKYNLLPQDYPIIVNALLRGGLSPSLDPGLRSKALRSCVRLLCKRHCKLPDGVQWRAVVKAILRDHIQCIHGAAFWGRDIRDSHCRNLIHILQQCVYHLPPGDTSQTIWNAFIDKVRLVEDDPDTAFVSFFIMSYLLPVRGQQWTGWVQEGIKLWTSVENCSLWNAQWISLFAKVAKYQPGIVDFDDTIPLIFKHFVLSLELPLGSIAPHAPARRMIPRHTYFLVHADVISAVAVFTAHALSPLKPIARNYFKRIIVLIENYCHPSNTGRWSSVIAGFISTFTSALMHRVTNERAATKAGVTGRVLSDTHKPAVAPSEHRLDEVYVDEIVNLILPLLKLGINSKSGTMTRQACLAARDLSVVSRHLVIPPMLQFAQEGLSYVQSSHRTSAALKLLATLSPTFLDLELYPAGAQTLTTSLELILPGIDINDTSKTDGALRVLAAAAAQLRVLLASDAIPGLNAFLEDYVPQVLDRIFTLLSSLEAPPKKNRNGSFPQTMPQVSILVLTVALDSLFAALPRPILVSAAKRISRQISGSATMNALKQYGVLVRSVTAAIAFSSNEGDSKIAADLFLPALLGQLLEDENEKVTFSSLSNEELVWRIRMLAQACRCAGPGQSEYLDRLKTVIRLSFERDERAIYKAGGRLLRGILEGLTSIQVSSEAASEKPEVNENGEPQHIVKWHTPSTADWELSYGLVREFFALAFEMSYGGDKSGKTIVMNREVLFRAIRLLHALQRGARWVLGGVKSNGFDGLEKFEVESCGEMTKAEALRAVRRPITAGLWGEIDSKSAKQATELWADIYKLIAKIVTVSIEERPDDAILLYRCLEPIELANEPFKKAGSGRIHDAGANHYKNIYRSVLSLKRPFDAEGGSGRAMPLFIFRLRVAGMHDLRLGYASRPGSSNMELVRTVSNLVADFTVNSFPRVRSEARGIFTRALRITPSGTRRKAVSKFVSILSEASVAAAQAQKDEVSSSFADVNGTTEVGESHSEDTTMTGDGDVNGVKKPSKSEIHYEKMVGAAHVLRSSVIAPVMMRSVPFYDTIVRAILDALLVAERPDAAITTGLLFFRLMQSARPLTLDPVTFRNPDLLSLPEQPSDTGSNGIWGQRRQIVEKLNTDLLSLVENTVVLEDSAASRDVHWRKQSLVASLLFFNIREDTAPTYEMSSFFVKGMVSDVVSVRQICTKALSLILALHGNGEKTEIIPCEGLNLEEENLPLRKAPAEGALKAIEELISNTEFVKKMINILALDHETLDGTGGRTQQSRTPGGYQSILTLVSHSDGYSCWFTEGGTAWPKSMIGRSRDTVLLTRVRLYESLFQNFGKKAYDAFLDPVKEIVEKVAKEEKGIILGVKDEDVRVIIGEVVAGLCRGMDLSNLDDADATVDLFTGLAVKVLETLTGPQGVVNGGTLIRLINTSRKNTVGSKVAEKLRDWLFAKKPVIAPINGSVARVQARLLRYIHSVFADVSKDDTAQIKRIITETTKELTGNAGFAHELKAVREEVARFLSLSVYYGDRVPDFDKYIDNLVKALDASRIESGANAVTEGVEQMDINQDEGGAEAEDEEDSKETVAKKLRSRLGETLSRLLQLVFWSSRSEKFQDHFVKLLPALFHSLDDQDKPRLQHARLALSLAAQGVFDDEHLEKVVGITEKAVKSTSWKIRGGVLPFVQVLLYMSQFTAPEEIVQRMRTIVINLISDPQIEVRAAAAVAFVPIIRDAPASDMEKTREMLLHVIKETQPVRRRRNAGRNSGNTVMTSDTIRKRHGAALALSSMVISSPYSVPEWMPKVLVALSNCVNDAPPISTSVKNLFVDFMRTHRDEWQMHKQAFTEEELDIVLELLVSPSYYA